MAWEPEPNGTGNYICPMCGALVRDKIKHLNWHRDYTVLRKDAD